MSSKYINLYNSCDLDSSDDFEFVHNPKIFHDLKSGKWIVEERWTTTEYDTEEEACISLLACSFISVPEKEISEQPINNIIDDNIKHILTKDDYPKFRHTGPKPQYDSIGDEDGNHWVVRSRWYTRWFKTEKDANRNLLSFSDYPDDDYEEEITFDSSVIDQHSIQDIPKNHFNPKIEYDPINKDYYIVGRWKTERFETKDDAMMGLLAMSYCCNDISSETEEELNQ